MINIRKELLNSFDPNDIGEEGVFFGLPFDEETAQLILLPVPWEATVSYGKGTSLSPSQILEASIQVDLFDIDIPDAWKLGIYMPEIDNALASLNEEAVASAKDHIDNLPEGLQSSADFVNQASKQMIDKVKAQANHYLDQGKLVGLLGGDHSTPFGLIQALGDRYNSFGILQIDAHADLRKAFEGFEYSHASIMYNVLEKIPQVQKLVQVGIRDFCEEEYSYIQNSEGRIKTFFDQEIKEAIYQGKIWAEIVDDIIQSLPEYVYISFDIDGLDPKLCPNTGTPVPGGFEFSEIIYLLKYLVKAGKKIISFDLVEVANPSNTEWDANVGARLLYKLCNWCGVSQGMI